MKHGYLSTQYRANVMRPNIRGQMVATPHTAADLCLDNLNRRFGAINILRNGPRILRAMDTVRREVAAKHGISED